MIQPKGSSSVKFCRAERPLRIGLRLLVGVFFVAAGLAKLTQSPLPGIPAGLTGFAAYLKAAGIPFPALGALVVCLVEIVGGLGLMAGLIWAPARRATRWFSTALALEMAGAMAFVGIRTALGSPVILEGRPVTNESYRLLLELTLFLSVLYLGFRRHRSADGKSTS